MSKTLCIKLVDLALCSDEGLPQDVYLLYIESVWDDPEIMDLLRDVKATDGRFYFPEWHPGIENALRCDAGSRNEFLSEMFLAFQENEVQ
jgi:hypothetical protein